MCVCLGKVSELFCSRLINWITDPLGYVDIYEQGKNMETKKNTEGGKQELI